MCIVNTPQGCVEMLRAAANVIERYSNLTPEQIGDTPWWEQFEAEGSGNILIDVTNDLLGIVTLDDLTEQTLEGSVTYPVATDIDYDAFFHSVIAP